MNIFTNTIISLNSQMALGGLLEVVVGRAEGIAPKCGAGLAKESLKNDLLLMSILSSHFHS